MSASAQWRGRPEKEVKSLALTRNFKQTVVERVERDPAFAQARLDEAATLFLNGEPETARLIQAANFLAIRERLNVHFEAHSVTA
jgi:hypothetical protein